MSVPAHPQYDDPAYQIFGNGEVAVQTAAPNVTGGRMVTVFDLTNISAAPLNADVPINRYAHANWDVQHIGAVLGLALDEAGNIFVSASQTWNADWSGPAGLGRRVPHRQQHGCSLHVRRAADDEHQSRLDYV